MSTNHTPNYNLCQWEPGDQVKRTDFNEDNAKIDAALMGLAAKMEDQMVAGVFIYRTSVNETEVNLGFRPRLLITFETSTELNLIMENRGIHLYQDETGVVKSDYGEFELTDTGFSVASLQKKYAGRGATTHVRYAAFR